MVITVILKAIIAKEINNKLGLKMESYLSSSTLLVWVIIVFTFFITNRINLKRRLKSISDQIYI